MRNLKMSRFFIQNHSSLLTILLVFSSWNLVLNRPCKKLLWQKVACASRVRENHIGEIEAMKFFCHLSYVVRSLWKRLIIENVTFLLFMIFCALTVIWNYRLFLGFYCSDTTDLNWSTTYWKELEKRMKSKEFGKIWLNTVTSEKKKKGMLP